MAGLTAWTAPAPTCRPVAAAKPLASVSCLSLRHSCSAKTRSPAVAARRSLQTRRQINLQVSAQAQDAKTEPGQSRSYRAICKRHHLPSLSNLCLANAAGPVNDTDFKEKVLDSKVPVLIDFWAPWCGPCRMIAPIVDELATEYSGKMAAVSPFQMQNCMLRKFEGSVAARPDVFTRLQISTPVQICRF